MQVYTPKGMFVCRKLIVSAGAWINHVLGSIGLHIPVYVTQEQVTYFATPHVKEFTKDKYTNHKINSISHIHSITFNLIYTLVINFLTFIFIWIFFKFAVILFGFTILRSMTFTGFQFMAIPEVRLALTLAALW